MNIGAMLMYPPNGWRTSERTAAYATPTTTQPTRSETIRRRSGLSRPSIHARVEGVPRDHQRPVHVTAEVCRPVGRRKRAPDPRRVRDQRVHHDDGEIVEGELVPERAEVDHHGAQGDG